MRFLVVSISLLWAVAQSLHCQHGTSQSPSNCHCDANFTLRDCSLQLASLAPVFATRTLISYNLSDPSGAFGDRHPFFPQNDVVQIIFGANFSQCSVRTNSVDILLQNVRVKVHGMDSKKSQSLKVTFADKKRQFGVEAFVLKSSQSVEPSLIRERLAQRFFRSMGLAAPRESFAVVSVEGENESRGLFTIQEAIDRYFFTARWGPDAWKNGTQLWKMGDRHNNFKDSPKVSLKNFNSSQKIILYTHSKSKWSDKSYLNATKSVVNGNGTAAQINQLFSSNFLMPSMAADAVTANRDGRVLGHNYYLFKQIDSKWIPVVYDVDLTLGQHPPQYPPSYAFDWPLQYCAPSVSLCGRFLTVFAEQYKNLISLLLGPSGYVGSGAFVQDVQSLGFIARQLRSNRSSALEDEIIEWMSMRKDFLTKAISF